MSRLRPPSGTSLLRAPGPSQLRAPGSSQLRAPGPSQLRAPGSSQLRAPGSSQLRAPGSSQLRTPGPSQLRAPSSTAASQVLQEPGQDVVDTTSQEPPNVIESSDNTLDTEFSYYCARLQELIPAMRVQEEQELANRWLTKLVEPSLGVKTLRDKRNRFLMMLCVSLTSRHIQTPFNGEPPAKLPEIASIKRPKFETPAWHSVTADWKEHLTMLSDMSKKLKLPPIRKCGVHAKQCTGGKDARATFLDRQFEFFLHLTRGYLGSLTAFPEQRIACRWIEALCQVDRNCCARAKGIRNDYLMTLMSHLLQHQLAGPFRKLPSHPLVPLQEAAATAADNRALKNDAGAELHGGSNLLSQFPIPEEGAFAYISLSSDLMKMMS